MFDKNSLVFTIVTPSFNQGKFIKETILSVITQKGDFYIQYIVMDGGSKDETVEILKEISLLLEQKQPRLVKEESIFYTASENPENWIHCKGVSFVWFSEKDKGQTNAINKGWKLAKGNIIAWINSDDIYLSGTFQKVANSFSHQVDAVFGGGLHITKENALIEPYPSENFNKDRLLDYCYICQPTVFLKRDVYEIIGELNESLHFCMDYEYWIRISQKYLFTFVPSFLACTRFYDDAKTSRDRFRVHKEIVEMQTKQVGKVSEHWIDVFTMIQLTEKSFIQNSKWNSMLIRIIYPFSILKNKLKYNRSLHWKDVKKSFVLLLITAKETFKIAFGKSK